MAKISFLLAAVALMITIQEGKDSNPVFLFFYGQPFGERSARFLNLEAFQGQIINYQLTNEERHNGNKCTFVTI